MISRNDITISSISSKEVTWSVEDSKEDFSKVEKIGLSAEWLEYFLLIGILAAKFFGDIVSSTVKASGLHTGDSLGTITRWAIVTFSIIASLAQLQIATAFLQDLFRAVVAMLAIAGGLAFGLGGKEHAKKILDSIESDLKN
jgi:hypothetical protein